MRTSFASALSLTLLIVAAAVDADASARAADESWPAGPQAEAVRVEVSTADELMAALDAAKGGETLVLAAGDYGALRLSSKFPGEVTIRSLDPDAPASFSQLRLDGVENLAFEHVIFDYTAQPQPSDWYRANEVRNSHHIAFRHSTFDGGIMQGTGGAGDGYGTGHGLQVTGSSNIAVEGNTFYNWRKGAIFQRTDQIDFSGNEMYHLREDALNFIQVNDVLIEGNHLHTMQNFGAGHADFIQFWTLNTTAPSTNITISKNILDSGAGSTVQSIFMTVSQSEEEMWYRDILIEENVIHNAHTHGITVGASLGLVVRNNTLLQNVGADDRSHNFTLGINLSDASRDVVVSKNIVPARWNFPPAATEHRTVEGNLAVVYDDPDAEHAVDRLFVNARAGKEATLDDLRAVPGGLIEQLGVGAAATVPEPGTLALLGLAGLVMLRRPRR